MSAGNSCAEAEAVLAFWFADSTQDGQALEAAIRRWFHTDTAFDQQIHQRFGHLVAAALDGGLREWEETPRARLALVLLLDQFTRNCFRGSARAYAGDARAQSLVREGIARGFDMELAPIERGFFNLPLEHAEDAELQALSVERSRRNLDGLPRGALRHHLESFLEAAVEHAEVIARFGRYPHRNKPLGRPSTPAELAYLDDGGKSWGQTASAQANPDAAERSG